MKSKQICKMQKKHNVVQVFQEKKYIYIYKVFFFQFRIAVWGYVDMLIVWIIFQQVLRFSYLENTTRL